MPAAINLAALSALRTAATFSSSSTWREGHTSFVIVTDSLTATRTSTITFRPFATSGSRLS
jgi:hypothetical protein